jgi:hypothetical protein
MLPGLQGVMKGERPREREERKKKRKFPLLVKGLLGAA